MTYAVRNRWTKWYQSAPDGFYESTKPVVFYDTVESARYECIENSANREVVMVTWVLRRDGGTYFSEDWLFTSKDDVEFEIRGDWVNRGPIERFHTLESAKRFRDALEDKSAQVKLMRSSKPIAHLQQSLDT